MDGFMKSLPHEQQEYVAMLKQTQGKLFNPNPNPKHIYFSAS
jgi:hypothetical protein